MQNINTGFLVFPIREDSTQEMKIQSTGESNFDQVFVRLGECFDITTQTQLAEILGVKAQTVSEAKRTTGIFPAKWAVILSDKYDYSIDFILRGETTEYPNPAFYKALLLNTERENAELKIKPKEQEFLIQRLHDKEEK